MKFGDRLRQGREARGVTFDAVLKETRIARRYLDALERSDLEALPGGAFNRGYIRSYAKFVGFDPLPILEAYAAAERMLGGTAEGEDRVLPGLPRDESGLRGSHALAGPRAAKTEPPE